MKQNKINLVVGAVIILGSGWMHYASTSAVSVVIVESSVAKKIDVMIPKQPQQVDRKSVV